MYFCSSLYTKEEILVLKLSLCSSVALFYCEPELHLLSNVPTSTETIFQSTSGQIFDLPGGPGNSPCYSKFRNILGILGGQG